MILIGPEAAGSCPSPLFDLTAERTVLKIGIDAGVTLVRLAQAYPKTWFIGVEIKEEKAKLASARVAKLGCSNACVVWMDALELLTDHIPASSLDEVLVFFPTPYAAALSATGFSHGGRLLSSFFERAVLRALRRYGGLRIVTDHPAYFAEIQGIFGLAHWWPIEWQELWPSPVEGQYAGTPCELKYRANGRQIFAIQLLKI